MRHSAFDVGLSPQGEATEVRMTHANDEVPEPPRHCMEDMDLVTSPYDD